MAPTTTGLLAASAAAAAVVCASAQGWSYQERPGFLAAGADIFNGPFNITGALAWCSANDDCAGFTFNLGPQNSTTPSQPVDVYFKSIQDYVCCDPTWASYTKTGPPQYPDVNFTVGGLAVGLRPLSHSVEVLGLVDDPMPPFNFSYVPPLKAWNRGADRSLPGCHQLGDITLRFQPLSETNTTSWALFSSSWAGFLHAAIPLPKPWAPNVQAADDITPLLNATPVANRIVPAYPLTVQVTRSYETDTDPATGVQSLVIRFNVTALDDTRIGGLGMSLPADDNTDQDLGRIAYTNSFVDPHIGSDHAWAEWMRIVGNASMLVTPVEPSARMEAWRPLLEDCNFNGAMSEWTVVSGGWFTEWEVQKQAPVLTMPEDLFSTGVWPDPLSPWPSWKGNQTVWVPGLAGRTWNQPSMLELKAGQTASYALRLALASAGPRTRDSALLSVGEPVLHAVPGYTIATDMNSTFLLVTPPRGLTVASVQATPAGVLLPGTPVPVPGTKDSTVQIPVAPQAVGKARVSVKFTDGTESVAFYSVLPSFSAQVAAYGQHLAHTAWLPLDYPDPFGRSASVMPWDREDGAWVLDDSRAYIVGLSDDAGAAQNLAHAMKVSWAPTQDEVTAKDDYVRWTLFGTKPSTAKGPLRSLQEPDTWGVRMTMYYYCSTPGTCDGKTGEGFTYNYTEEDKCSMPVGGPIWCMTENMANATYRGFNVPHQAATWLALYRVARNYDKLTTYQAWDFYLWGAYNTALQVGQASVGFMDGTVFREIVDALQTEGALNATIAAWATQLTNNMQARAQAWSTETFPYGSEFAYDTTGQEEVYVWLQRFGYTEEANATLNSILGYMRLIPNWAWHGGARSMGDLGNNGKWFINRGGERLLQHYRSGLNNIPVLEGYRFNPDDRFLLELGMGALTGQLNNIDPATGATSMGFHTVPFVLDYDPHSGDYGCGFFGLTLESFSAITYSSGLSQWLCFLCNVGSQAGAGASATRVAYEVRDAYRARTFLEPIGAYLIAEAGVLESVVLDLSAKTAAVTFAPATAAPAAPRPHASAPFSFLRLNVTKTAPSRPGSGFALNDAQGNPVPVVRGAFQFPPSPADADTTTVTLTWQ